MYEGVTIDCGLKIKNGKIVTEPQFDQTAIRAKIEALQVPQEWTVAKRKAREAAMTKRK